MWRSNKFLAVVVAVGVIDVLCMAYLAAEYDLVKAALLLGIAIFGCGLSFLIQMAISRLVQRAVDWFLGE